jgi:hypothetical protein
VDVATHMPVPNRMRETGHGQSATGSQSQRTARQTRVSDDFNSVI